jgi:predicted ATP-binding protein involved in virulence
MLAMVGDIAYRCAKLNPHLLTNSNQCAGIVLIDEIDMHLHPSWQQSVLNSLRQIFSNIQFIVTTHSPQILSTVKKCNIRVIDPSLTEALIPEVNPYGQASIVALEDIMNVKSIPIAVVAESRLLDKYLKIINSGDIFNTDLPAMREQLEQVFGVNNQKLMIADMMINKFKALQK